jgi:hypothetical protein
MNRFKLISYMFLALWALVVVGAAYVIISYATGLIGAIVDFVTTNDFTKLQQCGINPPAEFGKLKTEFASVILPALYLGLPVMLIIISTIAVFAGSYYYRGKLEDDSKKHEVLERDMVHKIVQKMEIEKAPAAKAVPPRQPVKDEDMGEAGSSREEEQVPRFSSLKKRK